MALYHLSLVVEGRGRRGACHWHPRRHRRG
jgi:hypothetical protein